MEVDEPKVVKGWSDGHRWFSEEPSEDPFTGPFDYDFGDPIEETAPEIQSSSIATGYIARKPDGNISIGRECNTEGSFNTLIGSNAKIQGDHNSVFGSNLVVVGSNNTIFGSNARIKGSDMLIYTDPNGKILTAIKKKDVSLSCAISLANHLRRELSGIGFNPDLLKPIPYPETQEAASKKRQLE